MSIRERVRDAHLLYQHGHREGALLSVLIAVAASARRRYPKPKFRDHDAFVKWIGEEMLAITGGRVRNYNVAVPGADPTKWVDGLMPLGECLYSFIRCNLAHEATLPDNVEFFPADAMSLSIDINDTTIRLSDTWMDALTQAIQYAPENHDLYPEIANMPDDVVAWMLFHEGRTRFGEYMETRRARLNALRHPPSPA